MNGDEGEEDWSSRTQWWQKSLCVWGLWLSTLDSKRFDLKLTMAHNQDRLQNSDSSVVYGHGHIIYSHTVKPMLWSSLVWRGRHTITTSHQTANYEFEWPSSKTHLSLSLLSCCFFFFSSLEVLRERNVHFCIDFSSNKPNIHQFVSEHWIWCFFCISWPENDRLENLFFGGQASKWLMILSFKIRFLF